MQNETALISYGILPFRINEIKVDDTGSILEIFSAPINSSLKLYTRPRKTSTVIFSDNSFTKLGLSQTAQGFQDFNIDVRPWQDETFTKGDKLSIANLYTCSCPAYLHAKIRNPDSQDDQGRKVNIQSRAPAPSAGGASTYESKGILELTSVLDSWATEKYKRGFNLKHTIAAMFADKIKTLELHNAKLDTRVKFEAKLAADIEEVVMSLWHNRNVQTLQQLKLCSLYQKH